MIMTNPHHGGTLDEFLDELGEREEVDAMVAERRKVDEAMKSALIEAVLKRPEPRPSVNACLALDFDAGEPAPGTRCMREGCSEERWRHPGAGELVLCRDHGREVVEGMVRAPPLRQRMDYQSVARRTFCGFDDGPEGPPKRK